MNVVLHLVADDVADTGKTLERVRDFCAGYVRAVRTAVIYEKPPVAERRRTSGAG
jgi:hypoxanthine phosphoribosyltransferase